MRCLLNKAGHNCVKSSTIEKVIATEGGGM